MTRSAVVHDLIFDVEADFAMPDVAAALAGEARVERSTVGLRSAYFDTAERALLRAQMTLRRRTGVTDLGWQLKVRHAPFRREIHVASTDVTVPGELRDLLLGVARGRPLVQVATVITDRTVARLLDAEGRRLAEIHDDTMHSPASGYVVTASSWREVRVELGDADPELLQAIAKMLRRAGARPAVARPTLSRAMSAPGDDVPTGKRDQDAGGIVGAYIAEQQRVILAGDLALRSGDDSAIHRTRVATRRLRSTLRTFATLFQPGSAANLDAELRWFAALLGQVRDRQVLTRRLNGMLGTLDDSLQLGPVAARINTELRQEQDEHRRKLEQEMIAPRYLELLEKIDEWIALPPEAPKARAATKVIEKLVRGPVRKVRRRLHNANATGDFHLLHGARKAAKRARYAAEAAEPVVGRKAAAKTAKRYQRLQDLLGEHQDSLVSADLLRRLAAKAGTIPGENGFTFGILYEREQCNATAARQSANLL